MKRFLSHGNGLGTRRLAFRAGAAQDFSTGKTVSSQIATRVGKDVERRAPEVVGRQRRVLAVLLLGPLTALGGLVWAIAQPYRIAFFYPEGKGAYDYLVQPPLLVMVVGLVFMVLVAPGLAADLEQEDDGSES